MAYTFKHGDRPLDDFTIQRAVGSGGFGEVYYAISDGGREVALKYLRSNPQVELRGVSHCINLKSPHLVAIFDVKQDAQGEYYIIMEYCSGPSLRDLLIAEPHGFGTEKAAFFVRELGKGLAYLHDRGIVHRDLKPGNIFYDDGYVKIGDYGLSKFISVSRHSAQTASVGTVHYMAPEIGSGNYGRGVDIYALGVMLYEMLLGKVPFDGSSMGEVLMKHLTSQPAVDELPDPFSRVIRKALEKDPKDRYQSVEEMVTELLDVDHVRESLAGFSPKSLEGAVRHGAGPPSPFPSPNPMPARGRAFPPRAHRGFPQRPGEKIGQEENLPPRLAKKMERIARKLDKRMARLAGISPPVLAARRAEAKEPAGGMVLPSELGDRRKRLLLSLLMSFAIAMGVALLVGNHTSRHTLNTRTLGGISAFLMLAAMAAGITLSYPAMRWFTAEQGPRWAQRVITTGCCGIPMLVGAIPLLTTPVADDALVILFTLLLVANTRHWNRIFQRGKKGEMSFTAAVGMAFWALVLGGIVSGIAGSHRQEYVVLASAVIAGATSLILQVNAWWLVSPGTSVGLHALTPGKTPSGFAATQTVGRGRRSNTGDEETLTSFPLSAREATTDNPGIKSAEGLAPLRRSNVTRSFWALFAFVMMGLVIVLSLVLGISDGPDRDGRTSLIVTIIGASILLSFSLRKTMPFKRPGFWRESLRPFVLSLLMFVIGALITGFSRYWDTIPVESIAAAIIGLVFASLLLIVLVVFTVREVGHAHRGLTFHERRKLRRRGRYSVGRTTGKKSR